MAWCYSDAMSTITFDTLKYVKQLESAGVSAAQAEAFVVAQRDILSDVLETQLATKADIRLVRDDIVKVERRMDGLDAKFDKLSWMLGILIALAAANFGKQFF